MNSVASSKKLRHPKRIEALSGAARYRRTWVAWAWMALPVIVVITFYVIPFIITLVTSFTRTRPLRKLGKFVGFANYQYLVTNQEFWMAVFHSVFYAVCIVPLMIILPLLLALLVKEYVPGVSFFRAIYYIPSICSLVVISLAWRFLLDADGPINNFLRDVKVISKSIPFLSDGWLILICAMIITLWQGLPYYMIMYLSALANVDRSLYEAAEMDGAGAVTRFFTVTVPGVKIMMYLVGLLSATASLRIFTEVYLLGGANSPVSTITMYLRNQVLDPTFGNIGRGNAASVFLFLLTIGLILLSQRLQAKVEN